MKTSESIKNIIPSLLKAQSEMGSAVKGASNPFFHSDYADLPSVMEVVKEPLNTNGIVILQPVDEDKVKTVLLHSSGEWVSSEGTRILNAKPNDPQAQGSAITYAKRYDLQSLLFVPTKDDDGEKAMDRKSATKEDEKPKVSFTAVARSQWEKTKPSVKQAGAVVQVAVTQKKIDPMDKGDFYNDVLTRWSAGVASDYIGNKISFEEATERTIKNASGSF